MVDTAMSSRVELFLSCKNLPNLDTFSKTDPFVVVSLREATSGVFKEIGRTETINDNLNPQFAKKFIVEYFFEESQELKFDVYDSDSTSPDLSRHDYIGYFTTPLGSIVSAPGQNVTDKLKNKSGHPIPRTTITVRCEELTENKDYVNIQVGGDNLQKMDLFGKSDPYLQFFRVREDNTWVQVHQTEVVKTTLNPRWKPFTLTVSALCNGDMKRPILVKCWDWDRASSPDFIGEFQTNMSELREKKGGSFTLLRPLEKKPEKRTKPRGTITFSKFDIIKEFTFIDYLKGGMQLGMVVCIDYTGSNGNPEDSTSLHYRRGTGPNEYQQAISTIGQIVSQYDTDGKFPVYGFGAKVDGTVRHCFPLTFNEAQPEVVGVDGILAAYHNSFSRLLLSGPTYFSEIIRTAASIASQPYTATLQHYTVLLILTDGVINDMNETIGAIVDASTLPLSIIIVGVGNADFEQMDKLDGDKVPLEYKGKRCARDIVQFVPMRDFRGQHVSRLAKETLAEVPRQLVTFAKQQRIIPMPERKAIERASTMMPGMGMPMAPMATPMGHHPAAGVPPVGMPGMPPAGVPIAMTPAGAPPGIYPTLPPGGAPTAVPPHHMGGPPPLMPQPSMMMSPSGIFPLGAVPPPTPAMPMAMDPALYAQQQALAEQKRQLDAQMAAFAAQQAAFAQQQPPHGAPPQPVHMMSTYPSAPPPGYPMATAPPQSPSGPTEI